MSQAASKFVQYGSSTTSVLVSATKNAAGIEEQNAQLRNASGGKAKEASAIDVWTHTTDGLAERMMNPLAGRQSTFADSLSGQRSQEYDTVVDGMSAQIGNVAAEGANLLGLGNGPAPQGVLAKVGATFGLLTSIEQMLSMPLAMIPFPAFPALRVMDMDIGLPHAHAHPPNLIPPAPPVPLPSTGPIIPIPLLSGSTKTLINGMPAARCGDMGLGIWCGGYFPMYEVFLGSSSVWIEGARAARLGVDITKHCIFTSPKPSDPPMGPMIGMTICASPNVLIGGVPLPSLLNFAMGAAIKGLFKVLGKAVGLLKKTKFFSRLKAKLKRKPLHNKACAKPGCPVYVLTGATVDNFVDYELAGPIPFAWKRYYDSSMSNRDGPMGRGFRHEYERHLRRTPESFAYTDQEGDVVEFPSFAPGEIEVTNDGLRLRQIGPETYEINESGQPTMGFHFSQGVTAAALSYLKSGESQVEFQYDSKGWLVAIRDSTGRLIHITHDRAGHILGLKLQGVDGSEQTIATYRYNAHGNLIIWRDALGAEGRYEYDTANRMTRITDRNGYSYHHTYDEQGRCIHSSGDDGLYGDYFEYRPQERCTIRTTGDGGKWIYRFAENGACKEIVDPYGGATKFKLGMYGQVVEEIDPAGNTTKYVHDRAGGNIGRIDYLGYFHPPIHIEPNPPDPLAYSLPETPREWEFGSLGSLERGPAESMDDPALERFPLKLVHVLLEESSVESRPDSPTQDNTQAGYAPRRLYDAMERLVEEIDEDGRHQCWRYDRNGNTLAYRDRDGRTHRMEYSSWNLNKRKTDPLGNATSFEYSLRREVTRVIDPGGTESKFVYDLKDRLIEVHRRGRLKERYRYDSADNLIEKLDANGNTLLSFEVGRGNLHTVRRLASGETQHFQYDESGRFTRAATDEMEANYEYDLWGRLVRDERDGRGVSHDFSGADLGSTKIMGQFEMAYLRDPTRENAIVIQDPTGARHRIRVNGGNMVSRTLSNGTTEVSLYDKEGRCLRKISVGSEGSARVRSCAYKYSAEGDLLAVVDSDVGTTSYDYDGAGRLARETLPDGKVHEFRHDAAGNLLAQPGLRGVEMGDGNRLVSANNDRFMYNERDNVSSRTGSSGTTRYEYDSRDMLTGCQNSRRLWKASYDPLGRRVSKSWEQHKVEFYWDDERLAAEVRDNKQLRIYIYADSTALVPFMFVEYDGVHAAPESGRRYFIFTNQVGSPIRVEDDDGKTVWGARVDPYGRANVEPDSTVQMPLRFPGHYHDQELGLNYNRFRYYSPELGRYLQSDPMGIAGGTNLYSYPADPLTNVDLDGLLPCKGQKAANSAKKGKQKGGPDKESTQTPVPPKLSKEEALELLDKINKSKRCYLEASRRGVHELPPTKTAASAGDKCYASGTKPKKGFDHVSPDDVKARSNTIDHELPEHKGLDNGDPGSYNACHAEKQAAVDAPNEPIGVSRNCCPNCRDFLKKQAVDTRQAQVVTDQDGTKVFHPNGAVEEIPW